MKEIKSKIKYFRSEFFRLKDKTANNSTSEKMLKLFEISQMCQNELNVFKDKFLNEMKDSLNKINDQNFQNQTSKFLFLLNKQSELNLKLFKENLKIYQGRIKELNSPSLHSKEDNLTILIKKNRSYSEEKKVI